MASVSVPCPDLLQNLTILNLFSSESSGFILVYSIVQRSTFERLAELRQMMVRVKRNPPVFILVGNKSDKTYEREVSKEEGEALARKFGCEFFETSARSSLNVEKSFATLVRRLRVARQGDTVPAALPPQKGTQRRNRGRKCIVM